MEEGHTALEELGVRQGALEAMRDDQIPPNEQIDFALDYLGWLERQTKVAAAPFQEDMKALMETVTAATSPFDQAVGQVKQIIRWLVEQHCPDEKHDSDVGTAQIVRPKNRISYNAKGLETLRLSLPEVDDLIGHLRKESPSKPYLKVKVK